MVHAARTTHRDAISHTNPANATTFPSIRG